MSPYLFILSILLPSLILYLFSSIRGRNRPPLPPGPRGLPIIGYIHRMGPLPHRDFATLSKTYGHIFHVRLGSVPTIVASSPYMAEQILKTHDAAFANRPPNEVFRCISYDLKGFAFTEYGPYWRNISKLCLTQLLSAAKIETFASIRKEELSLFVGSLKRSGAARAVVDVSDAVGSLVADVVCRMAMGRKRRSEDDEDWVRFRENTEELMALLGAFNINDFIPLLKVFDLQGMRKRMVKVHEVLDCFLEKIIDEHVEEGRRGRSEEKVMDFVDLMLKLMESKEMDFHFDRTNIKAVVLVS